MAVTNQTIGNVGLFYACYRLSTLGWNVMPTARNARGIDILAYSHDATRTITIQVKSLSKRSPVPLGNNLDHLFADFVVICRHVLQERPQCFILNPDEVKQLAHRGVKGEKISFWLQPRQYETAAFLEQWERIGSGNPIATDSQDQKTPPDTSALSCQTPRLTASTFQFALQCLFLKAENGNLSVLDVNAGQLHREVGGYPGNNHRMPLCCDALRKSMGPGDTIVNSPPKGNGASLTVRFTFPRKSELA
jgi:hypothetical protein